MENSQLVFLGILETELIRTLIPTVGDDIARRIATLAADELYRLRLDETIVPQLRAEALVAYRALLPSLSVYIDKFAYSGLDNALSVAETGAGAMLETALLKVINTLLAKGESSSNKLAGQLIAIDARVRTGKESAFAERDKIPTDDNPAEASSGSGLSEEQKVHLLDFLKAQFPSETNLRIASVKPVPGGFSKQTIFINLENNIELPGSLVMRCDAAYETTGGSVTTEYLVIQKVYAAGVVVPKPYAIDESGKVIGRKFILVSRAPGTTLGTFVVVNEPSREAAKSLALGLAKMHAAPFDGLESILAGGLVSSGERLMAEIKFHEEMWAGVVNTRAYCIDAAFKWLKANIALAEGPRGLVHRDVGVHNMLVHNNEVSAFLDWETVVIGNPIEDVAYTYYNVAQMMDWDEYLAIYQKATGFKLDKRQIDFYMLWGSLRVAVGISRMTDPVFSGKRVNLPEYYLGDYFGQILLQRISTKLSALLM